MATTVAFLLVAMMATITHQLQPCKFGRLLGGFQDKDCVCLIQPGIHSITTTSSNCKESTTRIVAIATDQHCYYTEEREKHFFLHKIEKNPIAIGYGADGGVAKELKNSVAMVFLGESTWKLTMETGSYCIKSSDEICTWKLPVNNALLSIAMESCVAMDAVMDCSPVILHGDRFCEEDPVPVRINRFKRDANDSATTGGNGTALDPSLDEDASLVAQEEIGHELMRTQIARYILTTTSKLVGLTSESRSNEHLQKRYPVLKLLELAKVVMQKTCPQITPSYFTMATNSFTNLQLESFHLKEPYISYPAFLRIETALKRCISEAKPHVFYKERNVTSFNGTGAGAEKEYCEGEMSPTTSNQTLRLLSPSDTTPSIVNLTIPDYATGMKLNGTNPVVNEPLIETVWKLVVNAHSYCYTKFSDYYNDHHSFTVALLPLFSNDVQDVWLGKGSSGYDLSSGLLYGGLLGDVFKLLNDVNNCVAASRSDGVSYPWFLNMPPKDKSNSWGRRRKKRNYEENYGYCLEKEEDFDYVGCF